MTKISKGFLMCGVLFGTATFASQPPNYYPQPQPFIQFAVPGVNIVIPGQRYYSQPYSNYPDTYGYRDYDHRGREWEREHNEGHGWRHRHHDDD
jgi:hypothetical protein